MNTPLIINRDSFQTAWAEAIIALSRNRWEQWNIVVHIQNPTTFNQEKHEIMCQFALNHEDVIEPNKVAYTIFPFKLYQPGLTTRERLHRGYWMYFRKTRHMAHSAWGTYFERMIRYPSPKGDIDQLSSIIDNINSRTTNYCAAHVMIIPEPHRDINKIMGAPCLNYLTVQVENPCLQTDRKTISLLAVYRNHDFRSRAYGNYLGLCKLLQYIVSETNSNLGMITCLSSHAKIRNDKGSLLQIATSFLRAEERNV